MTADPRPSLALAVRRTWAAMAKMAASMPRAGAVLDGFQQTIGAGVLPSAEQRVASAAAVRAAAADLRGLASEMEALVVEIDRALTALGPAVQ